jgi:hypothetical protein
VVSFQDSYSGFLSGGLEKFGRGSVMGWISHYRVGMDIQISQALVRR